MRDSKVAKRAIGLVGLLTAMLIAAGLAIPQIAGATPNPPGNNGTVKIHRGTQDVTLDSNPFNQPHVGCPFTVTFFGFDEGDVATVTFTSQAPSNKGTQLLPPDTVNIGADDNSGGGSPAGLDGAKTYALDFDGIVPQEQQGFHVKLTVTVTSPGSKTPKFNKFKVFWAQPCEQQSTTTTTTTTPTGGGGGGGGTTTTTGGGGGGGGGLGVATTPSGESLPETGSNSLPILITGLLLVAVGAGAVLATRRLRTR
jgi:LPXTG-motif cell wall-anchored protein